MNTGRLLRRINHELDVAHLPIVVAQELATEGNSVSNISETEDDRAVLKGT